LVSQVLEAKQSPFTKDVPNSRISAVLVTQSPAGSGIPGKRVSFGPYISPEYIDKRLPPSTPVKKGAPPPNGHSTPTPSLLKKASEKTPTTVSEIKKLNLSSTL